jgi:hypothetical protein
VTHRQCKAVTSAHPYIALIYGELGPQSKACATFRGRGRDVSEALSGIAPDDFRNADQRQDGPVYRPVNVTDHESDAECQVEALQDPDDAHEDHRYADQAADDPHHNVEWSPHALPLSWTRHSKQEGRDVTGILYACGG